MSLSRRAGSSASGPAPGVPSTRRREQPSAREEGRLRANLVYFSLPFSFLFFDEIENPTKRLVEHGGFERVSDELTILPSRDELRVFQEIKMVGNARGGHGERVRDFADGEIAFFEHLKNPPPSGIAERFKEKVQCLYN